MKKIFLNICASIVSVLTILSMSNSAMAMEKGKNLLYDSSHLIYAGLFPVYSKGLKEARQVCANHDGALLTASEMKSFVQSGALKLQGKYKRVVAVTVKKGNKVIGYKLFKSPIPVLNHRPVVYASLYCKPAKISGPKVFQLKTSTTYAQAQSICRNKGKHLLSSEEAKNFGIKFANLIKQGKQSLQYISPAKFKTIVVPYYNNKGNYGYRTIAADGSVGLIQERNIATSETRPYPGGSYGKTLDIGPKHPAHDYFYLHTKYGETRSINPKVYALISGCK